MYAMVIRQNYSSAVVFLFYFMGQCHLDSVNFLGQKELNLVSIFFVGVGLLREWCEPIQEVGGDW
jgi:hypothetical protein